MILPCDILGKLPKENRLANDEVSMRWKLLVLVSIIAAAIASGCWFLSMTLFFNGSQAILPIKRELWPLSLILPALFALISGFFVYRHTSRRRKTQAAITILTVLILTVLICIAFLQLLHRVVA